MKDLKKSKPPTDSNAKTYKEKELFRIRTMWSTAMDEIDKYKDEVRNLRTLKDRYLYENYRLKQRLKDLEESLANLFDENKTLRQPSLYKIASSIVKKDPSKFKLLAWLGSFIFNEFGYKKKIEVVRHIRKITGHSVDEKRIYDVVPTLDKLRVKNFLPENPVY